jgi:hypothetical protein
MSSRRLRNPGFASGVRDWHTSRQRGPEAYGRGGELRGSALYSSHALSTAPQTSVGWQGRSDPPRTDDGDGILQRSSAAQS